MDRRIRLTRNRRRMRSGSGNHAAQIHPPVVERIRWIVPRGLISKFRDEMCPEFFGRNLTQVHPQNDTADKLSILLRVMQNGRSGLHSGFYIHKSRALQDIRGLFRIRKKPGLGEGCPVTPHGTLPCSRCRHRHVQKGDAANQPQPASSTGQNPSANVPARAPACSAGEIHSHDLASRQRVD